MVELVIRVTLSLAVVLGLIWFVARTSSRWLGGASRTMVRVVARQPLARSASLAVVEVGERVLVVGVSDNGVSLLTEMDPAELPTAEAVPDTVHAASEDRPGNRGNTSALRPPRGLDGSLLSPRTWTEAWAAATGRNGGTGA